MVGQRLGDQFVLVHLETNQIYELNRTGARIWELMLDGLTRDQLDRTLMSEFEMDPERATREVSVLFEKLATEKLVKL